MEQDYKINDIDKDELLKKAQTLIDNQKWYEVISLLELNRQAINLSIEGLNMLGHCYSRIKDYDEAIVIYQELTQKQPHEPKWSYCLAYQYQCKKDLPSAIVASEKCLQIYPNWLKVYLELTKMYGQIGLNEKALKTCRDGIQTYKTMKTSQQERLAVIYSNICLQAAKLISSNEHRIDADINEVEHLFRESISADPQNADTWYRLGNFLLETDKLDDAIQYLQKAESLAPKKEYIPHKIAQAYLKKGDSDQALRIYETIPHYKRTPYILHGMAECLLKKGELKEGAYYLYLAIQREPEKWYHYRDLGLALANLGDRDQAIEILDKANKFYKKENGKDFTKILTKIKELEEMPEGERIVCEKPNTPVTTISYGIVTKYNSDRGFGFIKDDSDKADVFFHISKVKNRAECTEPAPGMRVKFIKEMGEKGLQASKVWVNLEKDK